MRWVSQYPYAMPPPAPIDPTDVAWKRVLAWVVDGIVFLILFQLVSLVLGLSPDVVAHDFGTDTAKAQQFCTAWNRTHDLSQFCLADGSGKAQVVSHWYGLVWIFLGLFVVYVVVQGVFGASVGKLALSLRVVKADGRQAGIGASFARTFGWIIDALTCGVPIIGGVAMFASTGHRRVGDMIAGTYVVPQQLMGNPVILPGQPGYGQFPSPSYGAPTPGPYGGPPPGQFGPPPGQFGPPPGQFGAPPGPTGPPPGADPGAASPTTPNPWAPTSSPPPTQPAPDSSSSDYEADVPTWDAERNTYIQYDSARQAWLEFDQRSQQWKPIST